MLLLPRGRRALGVVAALAMAGVAAFGVRYHDAPDPGRLDAAVGAWLTLDSPTGRDVASAVASFGSVPATLALGVVLAVLAWRRRGVRGVLLALIGPALAALVTEVVLKPWVARTLEGDLAYPSGHATRIAALGAVLVVLTARPGWAAPALAAVAVLAVAAVSTALVALGHHYATDVVAGAVLGPAIVIVTALGIDRCVRTDVSDRP